MMNFKRGSTRTALTVLSLAMMAAGCATVGADFKRPDAPTVQRYTPDALKLEGTASSSSSTDADAQHLALGQPLDKEWWKMFGSDAFDSVVQRALAGNRTLVAATSSLAEAQELVNAQAGTLLPQVSVNGGTGREKYGAAFLGSSPKPPTFTYYSVGANVSYAFDYTGGAARGVEQQRALAEYRQHQLDGAQLSVAGNTVMQALRIASLRAQIGTVEALLERDRENLKLVRVAFEAGSVARLDTVSAQSQIAADQTLLPPLRQQLSVARHALSVLMGSAPGEGAVPDFDIASLQLPKRLPIEVPSELARRRPDILAAEAQLHASTAAVGVAEGNLYPHLNLTASTGQQAVTFGGLLDRSSNVFGLAASLMAPIFDGGTLRAEKRAAVDAMQSNAANYQQTVLEAFGQVANSLQALEHGAEELQAHAQAQDAARDDVDLTRRSYQEGNVGVLQVLDAERRYQQARLGYVRAEAQRYVDTAQLFLALGGAGPQAAPAVAMAGAVKP